MPPKPLRPKTPCSLCHKLVDHTINWSYCVPCHEEFVAQESDHDADSQAEEDTEGSQDSLESMDEEKSTEAAFDLVEFGAGSQENGSIVKPPVLARDPGKADFAKWVGRKLPRPNTDKLSK